MIERLDREKKLMVSSYLTAVITQEINAANTIKATISDIDDRLRFYEIASLSELESQLKMYQDWKDDGGGPDVGPEGGEIG